MKKTLWMTSVLIVLASGMAGVAADSVSKHELKAKPAYIAMFKNGIGLVVTQVTLPEPKGTYRIHPLPDVAMGSFWLNWPKSLQLSEIKATQAKRDEKIAAATVKELLEANIGNIVDLWIRDEWVRAKIIDIPKRHDDPVIQPKPENVIPLPLPPARGEMALIEDSVGVRAVPVNWIESIRLTCEEPRFQIVRPQVENVLQFTAAPTREKSNKPNSVSLTYLANGIAWTPSYVVDISEKKDAQITAKAVIVNDLMPLENTDLELIAGFPHIQYGGTNSTFSLTPLQQALDQLRGSGSRRARALDISNTITSNRAMFSQSAEYAPGAPSPSGPSAPVMGEGAEDLYFYPVDNVTLKKGERGYYPLFNGKIPYQHVYTWDIPNTIDENANYRRQQEQSRSPQVVWHSLKLTNRTGNPWTTAPAVTMKDGRILGQDTIRFTPDGASADLKITQAISIHAEQNEYETKRQRSASEFYGSRFDLVTVEGELAITNFKDEKVNVEISKELLGEVIQTSGDPEIVKLAGGLRRVNPQSKLVWNIDVDPGKDNAVKLVYTFKVYVRG